jgi:hypothetical protein
MPENMSIRAPRASTETSLRQPKSGDWVVYLQRAFPFERDLYQRKGLLIRIDGEDAFVCFDGDCHQEKVEYRSLEHFTGGLRPSSSI